MYDIEKDIENVARVIQDMDNRKDMIDAWSGNQGIPYLAVARAALNASDTVKQLKELQERYDALVPKAIDLINWIDEFQPRCDKPQGSYVHLLEEFKDFKKALTPPKKD